MTNLNVSDLQKIADLLNANGVKLWEFEQNFAYDTGIAQWNFDDFIAENDGYEKIKKDSFLVIFGDDGITKNSRFFSPDTLNNMTVETAVKTLESLGNYDYGIDDADCLDDMLDFLESLDYEDYYDRLYRESRWYDLPYDSYITGYSQGDVLKVVYVGNAAERFSADYLENLYFGTPFCGTLTISCNGDPVDEIPAYELLADESEYGYFEKADILSACEKMLADKEYWPLLEKWLDDNLPRNFDYV